MCEYSITAVWSYSIIITVSKMLFNNDTVPNFAGQNLVEERFKLRRKIHPRHALIYLLANLDRRTHRCLFLVSWLNNNTHNFNFVSENIRWRLPPFSLPFSAQPPLLLLHPKARWDDGTWWLTLIFLAQNDTRLFMISSAHHLLFSLNNRPALLSVLFLTMCQEAACPLRTSTP